MWIHIIEDEMRMGCVLQRLPVTLFKIGFNFVYYRFILITQTDSSGYCHPLSRETAGRDFTDYVFSILFWVQLPSQLDIIKKIKKSSSFSRFFSPVITSIYTITFCSLLVHHILR
jgi:hypothetical protein